MNNCIKLIGVDIDGTLVDEQKRISEKTMIVLNKAIAAGIMIVPITGRGIHGLPAQLCKVRGINYVVTGNGASVYDLKENMVKASHPLSVKKALEVFDLGESLGGDGGVLMGGYHYIYKKKFVERHPKESMSEDFLAGLKFADDMRKTIATSKELIEKINIFFNTPEKKYEALKHFQKFDDVSVSYAFDINIEINNTEATKGKGLLEVSRLTNIPLKNIMCIGDGLNDLEMITLAGIGVAMGNSLKELKEHSDYITLDNNHDGAAEAILRFALN
jgi:Cof subfamily protein (haloacid dehalogenase superfamily)